MTIPIQVTIGKKGGVIFNDKYITKLLSKEVMDTFQELGKDAKGNTIGTIWIDKNTLNPKATSAVGDFLEGLVFQGLNNYFIQQGAAAYTSTVAEIAESRLNAALDKMGKKESQSKFINETKNVVNQALPQIIQGLGITQDTLKKNIELYWQGGSSSEGDIKLIIGGRTIMIECKNYSEYFLNKNDGFTYFTLTDTDGKNFPRFWRFLKRHGDPFWTKDLGLPTNIWMNNILGQGFKEYIESLPVKTSGTYNGPSGALFNYMLQKGSFASKNVDQRAMIALERVGSSGRDVRASFKVDLERLNNVDYIESIFGYGVQQYYSFRNGHSIRIATLEIPEKSKEIIKANSVENLTEETADPGWVTTFHFVLQKQLFYELNSK